MNQDTTVLISNFSQAGVKKEAVQSLVDQLISHKVHVICCDLAEDENALETRNWLTFHQKGMAAVYPLKSKNKRSSRSEVIFEKLEAAGVNVESVVDYTQAEEEGCYLEGTRSMVLDSANEIAYASISNHTDEYLFIEFCEDFEYTPIVFASSYEAGVAVAYTSDVLFVGEGVAMIASSCIQDKKERKLVLNQLKKSGKELIFINEKQVKQGVTSILQVKSKKGELLFLIAEPAYVFLLEVQINTLTKYGRIVVFTELPSAFTNLRNFANTIEI